jgi:carbon-monoxide dehydrogenase small subunit
MILTSKALLDKKPKANEEDIKRHIGGNFCRCTGYNQIIDAVKKVAEGSVL